MIVQGEKIWLRPISEDDTEAVVKWRNKEFVKTKFLNRDPFTAEGHTKWLKLMVYPGKVHQFIIHNRESGEAVGSVFLRDVDMVNRKAEYGIFIGEESACGLGFGTEAARLMLKYAFESLKLHKVFLRVLADNDRAIASYENAGFQQEAYFKEEVLLDGKYADIIFMAKINREG